MDFSFLELLFVAIIALLVLGPEKMVKNSQRIGKYFGDLKNQVANFKTLVESEIEIKAMQKEAAELEKHSLEQVESNDGKP